MVSVLDSGSSSSGLSPGQGHCVVFLGKTLNSYSASLHPLVPSNLLLGGGGGVMLRGTNIPSREK